MENNIIAWIIVLASLVISAIGTVMIRNMLMAAVTLALTSAILTAALFIMGVQIAAIMELSVCAGLVTAVFASAISLTKIDHGNDLATQRKERFGRFLPLPFVLVLLMIGIFILSPGRELIFTGQSYADSFSRQVMWDKNALDMLGLALIILSGVLGVVVLFKDREEK